MQKPHRIGSNTDSCLEKNRVSQLTFRLYIYLFFYKKVKRENISSKEVLQYMIWASAADYCTQLSQMITE